MPWIMALDVANARVVEFAHGCMCLGCFTAANAIKLLVDSHTQAFAACVELPCFHLVATHEGEVSVLPAVSPIRLAGFRQSLPSLRKCHETRACLDLVWDGLVQGISVIYNDLTTSAANLLVLQSHCRDT